MQIQRCSCFERKKNVNGQCMYQRERSKSNTLKPVKQFSADKFTITSFKLFTVIRGTGEITYSVIGSFETHLFSRINRAELEPLKAGNTKGANIEFLSKGVHGKHLNENRPKVIYVNFIKTAR